ncbi:MAG TPA: hypothetical protein V6C65_02930 [Allocoleopsis sp.]
MQPLRLTFQRQGILLPVSFLSGANSTLADLGLSAAELPEVSEVSPLPAAPFPYPSDEC